MLIDYNKVVYGHYMNLEEWLYQNVGVEGIDYNFKYESIPSRPDSGRISEIVFVDPKMETLAMLRWS